MSSQTKTETGELTELHYRRLLVAIDGSVNSDLALSAAVTVAKRDNAALTLVAVETDLTTSSTQWAVLAAPPTDMQQDAHDSTERVLHQAIARLPADIPVTTVHRFGKAGPEIVAESETGDYDAILLGARGIGRVGSLLGSVSQYVLHHADKVVLITHAPASES